MGIKNKYKYLLLALLVAALAGIIFTRIFYHSYNSPQDKSTEARGNKKDIRKNLEEVNKFLVQKDAEKIQSFIQRRGWNMKKKGSGLWYTIYSQGKGPQVKLNDYVKIDFDIRLLDGTLCYSSDSTGPKVIQVGMTEEMTGLHEGLKLLREGDKARMIIPPYLAHGLLGDTDRIPARAILVYQIKVLEVSDEKIPH